MFSKPIRSAQFYYLDKFLLLASGRSLYMYLYNLDGTRDDIKRYKHILCSQYLSDLQKRSLKSADCKCYYGHKKCEKEI